MLRVLSHDQLAGYGRDGFVFPVPVLDASEVSELRGELEAWESARGAAIDFPEHVTAWVALSDASELAGCMSVLPGSQHWGAFAHDDRPGPDNMMRPTRRVPG